MSAFFEIIHWAFPHSLPAGVDSPKKRLLPVLLIPCFIFLNLSLLRAETDRSLLPAEFGEVIYRCQETSPKQLFIIGMAHRDALTGLSIPAVSRAQAEVYKLGEWLIQNERCELLLPEGFFARPAAGAGKDRRREPGEKVACPESIDIKTLEEKLSDNRSFVNAEMLLKRNYDLRLRQVEDPKMHGAVGELIRKLVRCGQDDAGYLRIKSDLDLLQERRTAVMIQRIPEIIEAEFREGKIRAPKAIFTIGLSHLPRIIRYLEEEKVRVPSPPAAGDKAPSGLKLKRENFGVSVLIPRALAGDRKMLKNAGLDEILERQGLLSSSRVSSQSGNGSAATRLP